MTNSSTDAPLTFEDAVKFLPEGLSSPDLRDLYDALRRLDRGIRYFSPHSFDFLLQGDLFERAPYIVISPDQITVRPSRVMLLSNTCDIHPVNERRLPIYVSIAPLIRFSRFREVCVRHGLSEASVDDKLAAAKAHKVSTMFFVAAGMGVTEDSVVLFDRIQSMDIQRFNNSDPIRLATLSQEAFWLLTVKLSMHFCRPQEGVARHAA